MFKFVPDNHETANVYRGYIKQPKDKNIILRELNLENEKKPIKQPRSTRQKPIINLDRKGTRR